MLSLSGALTLGLGPRGAGTPPVPAAPVITSSSITGTPQDGETLTANRSVTGYPVPTVTYQWQASGVNISGQTAQTIVLDAAGMGLVDAETISCEITATNSEGSDTDEPTIAFVGAVTIDAPTLTLTSGTSDPPVVTREIPANAGEGDYIQRRIATNSGYTTGLLEQERVLLWDGTDFELGDTVTFAPSPFTIQNGLSTGTPYFMSERFRRDYGDADLYSAWSANVTFTLDAPASESASSWATTTGANKSTYVTVNGTGNRAASGQAGFNSAPISVRSTQARSGKRQFELVISNRTAAYVHIGVDDGTDNLADTGTTNFSRPGRNNSSGVGLKYGTNGGTWEIGVGGAVAQSGVIGTGPSSGDSLFCVFDTTAGTVSFYIRKSGVTTQVGTTVTGLAFASYYANCGFEDADTLTATFANAQNRALDSGYSGFDNL